MTDLATTRLVKSVSDLLTQAGQDTGLSREQVERVLVSVNVVLKPPVIADRRIRVLNIAAMGVKNSSEPFAVRRRLAPGVWAIVHPANSAGTTTLRLRHTYRVIHIHVG